MRQGSPFSGGLVQQSVGRYRGVKLTISSITSEEKANMIKVDKRWFLAVGLYLIAFSSVTLADSLNA